MNEMFLTEEEGHVIEGVIAEGAGILNSENMGVLGSAIFKVGIDTLNKVVTSVASDAKLRRDLTKEIIKETDKIITSVNELFQKNMDALKARQDAYIEKLKNNPDKEDFITCVAEIRDVSDKMDKIRKEAMDFEYRTFERKKSLVESTPKESSSAYWWSFFGGAAAGVGGTLLYNHHQNKKLQGSSQTKTTGKIK